MIPCPLGMYRKSDAGATLSECEYCPRGVYGARIGLTSSECSGKCPQGTYNDGVGATSIQSCRKCPEGVYGSTKGLQTSACTAPCPKGKYSVSTGLASPRDCLDCPPYYHDSPDRQRRGLSINTDPMYRCDGRQHKM